MSKTLEKAAGTILNEPIKLEVDYNPQNWLQKVLQKYKILPTKKTYYIKTITLRNLIRVSKHLLDLDPAIFNPKDILNSSYRAMEKYPETIAKIVAIAIHNKRSEPPESLVQFILDQFTAKELEAVLSIVVGQLDIKDFMTSIISVRGGIPNVLEGKAVDVADVNPQKEGEKNIAPGTL